MSRPRERGAALLLVVLLVALLAVLVVEFQREARVELRSARSVRDDIQAHALVRSGTEVVANVLAIYGSQSLSNLQSAIEAVPGGRMVWNLFFTDEDLLIPVPEGIEGDVSLSVRLGDLNGLFPLGALYDPQGGAAKPRQEAFKDYLGAVKQYLGSREVKTLDNVDTDDLAQGVADRLNNPSDPKMPIADLSELRQVEGFTPEVLKEVSPFLDTRIDWEFNVNRLSVPMLMAMKHISVEDAQTLSDDLRDNPILEDGALANDSRLQGRDAQLFKPENLKTKSRGFAVFLEAEIQGVKRRAKAVFRRPVNPPPELGNRYLLEEWVEGWVEDWPAPPQEPPPAASTEGSP